MTAISVKNISTHLILLESTVRQATQRFLKGEKERAIISMESVVSDARAILSAMRGRTGATAKKKSTKAKTRKSTTTKTRKKRIKKAKK